MPRKPKKETVEDDGEAENLFLSFKDRLDDWRKLPEKEQTSLLREIYRVRDSWDCLSSVCNRNYASAPGLQYHLARCGVPKEPPKKREHRRKSKAPPETTAASTPAEAEATAISNDGLPEVSDQEYDHDEANEEEDDESYKPKSKKRFVAEIKDAVEKFWSYRDRLDDWRKLTDREQNKILRRVFAQKKQAWPCLSSKCSVALGTFPGLHYHMKRCGVPEKDRLENCHICGEIMPKAALPAHKVKVHGHTFTHFATKAAKGRRPQSSSTANGSLEGQSIDKGEIGDGHRSFGPPRRRRVHVAFMKPSYEQYAENMTAAFEAHIKEAFGDANTDCSLFSNAFKGKWKQLDQEEEGLYLPYLTDSIRFSVEGIQKEGEITSLERFQSMKTGKGFLAFCGSAITAAAWCPTEHTNGLTDQYALVALNNDSTMGMGDSNLCGALQLWELSKDKNAFCLRYIIAHDYGVVTDIKWCPSAQWKPDEGQIGAIAVTSSIGQVGIYCIMVCQSATANEDKPNVYRPQPRVRLYSCTNSIVYSVDWSPYKKHDELVAGLSDGTVALWRLSKQGDANFIDEEGRLLPVACFEVASGPVRWVRWWSETKVMVASLDRQIALWDLRLGICLARFSSFQVVNFETIGSFFPAVIYSYDGSLVVPSATVLDFVCSGLKLTMPVINAHSSVVWNIAINPRTGEILTVDDVGQMCRSCSLILNGVFEAKKKKFIEEVVMKSTIIREGEDDAYDYADARRRCIVKFTFPGKLPSKDDIDKEFKEDGLSGRFPLNALYATAWNLNKDFSRWSCCGGQNGLLHVLHFEETSNAK